LVFFLKVPLHARRVVKFRKQYVEMLRSGEWVLAQAPFLPYLFTTEAMDFPSRPIVEVTSRTLLSTRKPTMVWRHEFDTVQGVVSVNNSHPHDKRIMENHVNFVERVAIDDPEFFPWWAHQGDPRIMFLDIEENTTAGKREGLSTIGMDVAGEIIQTEGTPEAQTREFTEQLKRVDVVVGYNHINYDLEVLRAICHEHAIRHDLDSKLLYDVAESVFTDQTLSGIKSRSMKNVGRWFGMDPIELDGRNMSKYPRPEMLAYNISDLKVLRKLFDIYWPPQVAVAEMTGLPLGMVLEGYSSTVPSILCARGLFEQGIISDGSNRERHPEIFMREGKKYQGAEVTLHKGGFFIDMKKFDFRSMYPFIGVTFNLSPDTCRLEGYEDVEPFEGVRIEKRETSNLFSYYDNNLRKLVKIEVDHRQGFLTKMLEDFYELRRTIDPSTSDGYSKSYGIKVLMNCFYGYSGNGFARAGDVSIAMLIAAFGRGIIRKAQEFLREEDATLSETDTDGIYSQMWGRESMLQANMDDYIERTYGVASRLKISEENYRSAWFASAKNYLLLKENGTIKVVGAGFKGSHRPQLWDDTVAEVAALLLSGQRDKIDVQKYLTATWPFEKAIKRVTLQRDLDAYEVESVGWKLAMQLKRRGVEAGPGSIIEYVETRDGPVAVAPDKDIYSVNWDKYRGELRELFKDFGLITQPKQEVLAI